MPYKLYANYLQVDLVEMSMYFKSNTKRTELVTFTLKEILVIVSIVSEKVFVVLLGMLSNGALYLNISWYVKVLY